MDIIEEEKERLERLLVFYSSEIVKLPKGHISKKKIKGNVYCYRSYRDGTTVKTIYIGKENSDEVKELSEGIKERQKLQELSRRTKKNLEEAMRALRAKK